MYKKITISVFALLINYVSFAQEKDQAQPSTVLAQNEKAAIITFIEPEHQFGKINEGEKAEHTFKFKNTGNTPLIITDVSVTCGCTAAEKPEAPIMPGAEGKIKIVFNSAGKTGSQNRTITVSSNAKNKITYLKMIGEVINTKK